MFKRVIWMGAGFAGGLSSSFWVKRAVNRRVRRYVPDEVRRVVGSKARSAGGTIRTAVAEGRSVMRQYQAEAESAVQGTDGASATARARLRAVPDIGSRSTGT